MRRAFPRLLAVLLVAVFGASCESPTTGGPPGSTGEANIGFALDLSGLPVATLVVQVTASDIGTPLVFNIPVVNGTASGNITVPAGLGRTITVRAFDAQGTVTHEGSATVTQVNPGANVNVTITMLPLAGTVPITIHMGSMVMTVTRLTAVRPEGDRVGDSIRFNAQVKHPDGSPVAGAVVRWASTNPAVATVDSLGVVVGRVAGSADIVATYNGFGATQTLTFTAGTTPPPPDQTAPVLLGVEISPDSVELVHADSFAQVSIAVTASDEGNGFWAMTVVLRGPDGSIARECNANAAPSPGTATRTCSIALSAAGGEGTWTVRELIFADNAGNSGTVSAAELMSAGFDHSVNVVVAAGTPTDTEAPVLAGAVFSPEQADVSAGTAQVTLRIEATDNLSGVARVDVSGSHEDGSYSFNSGNEGAVQVGPGTWETYLTVSADSPPDGFIYLDTVRLTDQAGNVLELGASELESRGMRARLYVSHGVVAEP